jgi:hypothetical protein
MDCIWIYEKIEKKVNWWCNKWISLGGRLNLIKCMVETTLFLGMLMAYITKGIVKELGSCVLDNYG